MYFQRHEQYLVVHLIPNHPGLERQEDEALQQKSKSWKLIEAAKATTQTKAE